MAFDLYIIGGMAILGIVDANLERYTGRGLIARVQDWIEGTKND